MHRARSDPWHDGTWWEVQLPPGWSSLGHDKSRKGWPHAFASPSGARLYIHVNDGAKGTRDVSWAPAALTPTQRVAYCAAASDTANDELDPGRFAGKGAIALTLLQLAHAAGYPKRLKAAAAKLKRIDRGPMVGFTYPPKGNEKSGWFGHFAVDTYWLVSWISVKEWNQADADAALDLLASITVHPPRS